jgi:hypothetical protein
MKKYLRCVQGGSNFTAGKRYEIVNEVGTDYSIKNDVGVIEFFTKEPDEDGDSFRNWFTLETAEQPRKIDGRKAEIINPGRRYDDYITFAEKYGYPEAAHSYRKGDIDRRAIPKKGDIVTLLVSAPHIDFTQRTLWIVEAANGERHIFNEKGLRILDEEIANITVMKDESLGGVEREYREVKRKATVGERIKVIAEEMIGENRKGEIYTVTKAANYSDLVDTDGKWDDGSTLNPALEEYVVLEPTDIIRIDGERLRMVDRKAAVGERVVVVNAQVSNGTYRTGDVLTVVDVRNSGGISIDKEGRDMVSALWRREYRVLDPVESVPLSAQPPLDQAAANIAALTAKVQALESRVATLEKANQPVKVAEGSADDAPPSFAIPRMSGKTFPLFTIEQRVKSPQEIRDEIVERAKADVMELADKNGNYRVKSASGSYNYICTAEFVVNRDKRKVTVILRGVNSGIVRAVGRAKCAPNDVFNAHIGKFVALCRALGLEVPAEYLNVPNPEEPRVGDVVVGTISGLKATVSRVGNGKVYGEYENGDALSTSYFEIDDDSRGEVAS